MGFADSLSCIYLHTPTLTNNKITESLKQIAHVNSDNNRFTDNGPLLQHIIKFVGELSCIKKETAYVSSLLACHGAQTYRENNPVQHSAFKPSALMDPNSRHLLKR